MSVERRQPVRLGDVVATRQRRLLLLDGLLAMALLEAPIVGISSEAIAVAPLLVASLAGLHLVAGLGARRGRG